MVSEGLLELTTRFALLDKQRIVGNLSPSEEKEWRELKRSIVRAVSGTDVFDVEDRRESLRVDMQLAVYFKDAVTFEQSYVKDISDGGMFIETDRPLTGGEQIDLVVHVGEPFKSVAARVEVVWVNTGSARGAGVRFLELSPEGRTAINELIHGALASKVKRKLGSTKPPSK
jgi:uncharacterized protein (TIGR02266 family)